MKNIKKIGRYGKRIAAMALVMAMLFGAVAMVNVMLDSALASDEEYTFLYKPLDVEFYKNLYPDVVAVVGDDPYDLWTHYWEHGMAEGRIPYAGAEPGVFVDGYTTVGINQDLAANATLVEQADATDTAILNNAPDLSDWTPEQLAAYAQKQIEFDASGLVHVGWTEQQVYEKLMAIKETYPEGMTVGSCAVGAGKIGAALYGADSKWFLEDEQGLVLCDKNGKRVMPVGYVDRKTESRVNGQGNIRDVRVGDKIYTKGSGTGHVSIVLTHDEYGITVVESNLNGDKKFHWGRRITWSELENGGNNIYKEANKWTKIEHRMY